jgi:hypothetical protein
VVSPWLGGHFSWSAECQFVGDLGRSEGNAVS